MKYFLSFVVSFILSLSLFAQPAIDVTYKDMNEEIEQLAFIMDVNCLLINIQGDLKGKKAVLKEHFVSDGITTTNDLLTSYTAMKNDSVLIRVMSCQISKDDVKIDIRSKDLFYYNNIYSLPVTDYILMETKRTDMPTKNIPIFAYTTGIAKEFNIDGNIHKEVDYCSLRDTDISPVLWYEKLKINNYYYFTIEIE